VRPRGGHHKAWLKRPGKNLKREISDEKNHPVIDIAMASTAINDAIY
jgi:hypothetical protein